MGSTISSLKKIYTIGYSSFDIEAFIATLKKYDITALSDVRSFPYSKFRPDYNRDTLSAKLREHDIAYVFLGENLGARFKNKSVYIDGVVDFELASELATFQKGINRLIEGSKKHTIVLMCAEKDPIECHRSILISKSLCNLFSVLHIHEDASIESHRQLENRLEKRFGLDQALLLGDTLKMAYKKQARKIAHTEEHDESIKDY